jgi:hypothetical protein
MAYRVWTIFGSDSQHARPIWPERYVDPGGTQIPALKRLRVRVNAASRACGAPALDPTQEKEEGSHNRGAQANSTENT